MLLTLPAFEQDGLLPPGLHHTTGTEFIQRFCSGDSRVHFTTPIQDLLDFAKSRGALELIVGGSFVSREKHPRDLDCVIVFADENQIPDRTERLVIEGTALDVFFCARTQGRLLAAFVQLFSETRSGRQTGVVVIDLMDSRGLSLWDSLDEVDQKTIDIVRRVYFGRHIVDRNNSKKALITVHGIRSVADWNAEVAHISSSNGWIFAPYQYGYVWGVQILSEDVRKRIVDGFRAHIDQIYERYHCHISVIAHSFGTYVVAKYLLGFDFVPVPLDTFIMTGSILSESLDIEKFRGRAAHVLNEVAPNDRVVRWAPRLIWDDLVGRSGDKGFAGSSRRLDQRSAEIFDHGNVIRRDVIVRRWMPNLEVNVGDGQKEAIQVHAEQRQSRSL